MSWALNCTDGAHQVIVYEALLALFASCRSIGLCLYHRERMSLYVINGALCTHPLAGSHGRFGANPFYDPATTGLNQAAVLDKLAQLDRAGGRPATTS